jgi:hypothetical protein
VTIFQQFYFLDRLFLFKTILNLFDELNAYVKKLKVYDYYLISNTQQDYKFDLKVLETTLGKLEKINGG